MRVPAWAIQARCATRTAQLQGAVATTLRDALPANRRWEADTLGQFSRLMRDLRNYGVHPRQGTDGDIEVYFTEDKCGLLFLEAHRHLKHLAKITAQVIPADRTSGQFSQVERVPGDGVSTPLAAGTSGSADTSHRRGVAPGFAWLVMEVQATTRARCPVQMPADEALALARA